MIHDEDKTNEVDPAEAGNGEELSSNDPFVVSETPASDDADDGVSLIDAFTAGGKLKAAREAKGKSIEDMAKELLINWRVLESLEQTIQPPEYDMRRTRIVARSYANALGIPAEPILADFPMEEEQDLATAIPKSSVTVSERGRRRLMLPVLGLAALVVTVAGAVTLLKPEKVFERRSTPSVAERVVAVNTAQESLFAREPAKIAANTSGELAIVALRPAWIEVRGEDGTIFRSRDMNRNEVYYPRVGAGWTGTVQDGSAFEWRLDDVTVGLLAETPEPIYSASIDDAAAVAEEQIATALAAAASGGLPSR